VYVANTKYTKNKFTQQQLVRYNTRVTHSADTDTSLYELSVCMCVMERSQWLVGDRVCNELSARVKSSTRRLRYPSSNGASKH